MKTKKQADIDYIKANRRGSREAELENESGFKPKKKIHKSLKAYSKKDRHKKINIHE